MTWLKSPRAQFNGMDPTAQWEEGTDIMKTKGNCDAALQKNEAPGTVDVLSAEGENQDLDSGLR